MAYNFACAALVLLGAFLIVRTPVYIRAGIRQMRAIERNSIHSRSSRFEEWDY